MDRNTAQFHARFAKVLTYIDKHLEGDLSLDVLADVAAFSKYHFQRQFSALFGMGVYRYVQLCRLKRASYQLAFRDDQPIIDIAMSSGYEGPESFSRAFRKSIGQTPSEFRRQPQWKPWQATFKPLSTPRGHHMQSTTNPGQVKIIDFRQTRIAVLEHRGDPRLMGDTIRKFIEWRKRNRLSPNTCATFNLLYNNPEEVAPEDFRIDICVATDRNVNGDEYCIAYKIIPGGRCATLRHVGSEEGLAEAIRFLYAEWLPQSGEQPHDFPMFVQRVQFFPDVPECAAVSDVFVLLR